MKKKYGLKMLFQYYKKHIGFFIAYLTILVVKAVMNFFEAMCLANTIALILDTQDYHAAFIQASIGTSIAISGAILSIVNTYFYKQLENRTKIDIQQMVLKKSLDIQMKSYDKMGSGIIVTRLTADIDALSTEFKAFTTKIVDLIKKFSYVIYIFFLNVWLGLFLVATIGLTIVISRVRIHYFVKLKPNVRKAAEKVNSRIIEVVRGVKDIKTLNCADSTLTLMRKDQEEYARRDNVEWYVGVTLCNMGAIMKYVMNLLFIMLCIYFLRSGALIPIVFYTCFLYKDNILDFANILEELELNLSTATVYASRIFMLTDETIYPVDEYGKNTISEFTGNIEFKNVSFDYDNGINVLNGASFTILPKQTVAFVGESGCGKSTIINLIAHLYYKSKGDILFDGVKIEDLDRDFIKNNVAVVNQFPYIFNLSIRENFKVIKPDITDEEIFKLCRQTNIYNHIQNLPLGLDSIIGENGCQFSGGQKQKLCIARALARDVKILIFDEATSALDNSNQKEIMRVIEKLKNKVTVILVAHRLSTITYADCIYIMQDGKIVAQGNHEELLESNTYYKDLYLNSSASNL